MSKMKPTIMYYMVTKDYIATHNIILRFGTLVILTVINKLKLFIYYSPSQLFFETP